MEPMSRLVLPYLSTYKASLPQQEAAELVGPTGGKVHVLEHELPWSLDAWRADGVHVGPLFLVRTPRPGDASLRFLFDTAGAPFPTWRESCLVPCTAQTCRRWVEAALAYATAVDDISAELVAAHRRASSIARWRHLATHRALRGWEKTRQRYERVMQEASEAYKPVRREIWQAIQAEKDKAAEHARQEAQARRRRAELAERPIWGWSSVATNGQPTAYIFRHDVPADDSLAPTSPQVNPPVGLAGLRHALKALKPIQLQWDSAAISQTERELEGVSFESWWRELFSEDYRTFTSPPPSRSSSRPPIGGTGTGGTGGFTGGFSFGGY
ncbi:hypothetical protein OG625_00375 [Streptomyces sp. NBC_01351]|uniref:hypothetical protein n=1 Tax=Streptomyces sp. NBC_01351 TaxID=2903833 RepID=UPI002E37870D|nr:hypothetical protein [Streptomyces sp. NBC_01351]